MDLISVKDRKGSPITLAYEENGAGKPILFLHPWPLSKRSWDSQVRFFAGVGFRAITYDRRGFGESSKSAADYDYDTLADDLNAVLQALDLHDLTLVGLSMGGGELARYLRKYGASRISHAVFIASMPPKFSTLESNLENLREDALTEMQTQLHNDRANFMKRQMQKFFATSTNLSESNRFVLQAIDEAKLASTDALVRSIDAWRTDLSQDFEKIGIPTLIINGRCDQLTPVTMGEEIQRAVKGSKLFVIENASHGLAQTHADAVNSIIHNFILNRE